MTPMDAKGAKTLESWRGGEPAWVDNTSSSAVIRDIRGRSQSTAASMDPFLAVFHALAGRHFLLPDRSGLAIPQNPQDPPSRFRWIVHGAARWRGDRSARQMDLAAISVVIARHFFNSTNQDDRMTVSPNRPTDGSRPLQGENGPQQDGSELPPVLFRLPDLGTSATPRTSSGSPLVTAQQSELPVQVSTEIVAEYPVDSNEAMLAASMSTHRIESGPLESIYVHQTTDPQPAAASSYSAVGQAAKSVPKSVLPDDRPAGRSWAEAAMAHRNVLMMLAFVVAVALWTSRRSSETTEIESTLAREGIAMDQGVAGIDAGTLEDFSVSLGEPSIDQRKTSSPIASVAATTDDTMQSKLGAATNSVGMEVLSSPIDAPEVSVAANAATSNSTGNVGEAFDETSLSANNFASSQGDANSVSVGYPNDTFGGTTPATVVASRRPSDGVGLPSLEDLESEPALSEEGFLSGYGAASQDAAATGASLGTPTAATAAPASLQPIPSSTPNGVVDWLKYAPDYPPAP